ncbi:MAG: hypothetical protein ABIR28_09855 [Vicinamibacteria bacterium]
MAAGRRYRAGLLHRWVLGEGYRRLWGTSIEVEVLDLAPSPGGLTPKKKGGGKQTKSLTLESADGRQWKFRSIDKDTSALVEKDLRGTFVDGLVQDQISAAHPLGPLMVDPLQEALGIPGSKHRLVLLPDDERLGEFRKDFGGTLGFIEEKIKAEVTPGFEDYDKLLDTVEVWARLDEHPEESVDAKALLKARLFDIFINDFDRHKDQWQWARRKGSNVWTPIPEDRDQAFVRFSGLAITLIRPTQPRLVDFGRNYPGIFGLTWQGRFVDRRHLASLEWPQWEEVVKEVQAAISDNLIDEVVTRLPKEYQPFTSEKTATRLKSRARKLPEAARKFYEQLAENVEIYGSHQEENVVVSTVDKGLVQVRISEKDGTETFLRRFDPVETNTIRLYLKGGNDHVVREKGTEHITLRVVGGTGDDTVDDSKSGGTHIYDEAANTKVLEGPDTSIDRRPYTHPLDSAGNPERDWGRERLFVPWLKAGDDVGIFLGGNFVFTSYAFRHHPFARRHTIGVGYSTGLQDWSGEYKGEFVRGNGTSRARVYAQASEVELIRFYGFGNNTLSNQPDEFYRVRQKLYAFSPQYQFNKGDLNVFIGGTAQYTSDAERPSFASSARPYGYGNFGKIGPKLDIEVGPRDRVLQGSAGGRLKMGGTFFPKAWTVEHPFGEAHGEASVFLRAKLPLRPTIALRGSGKKVFGTYPFQEAAFIGGADTVRGLRPQRYAGDGSVYGTAELRFRLGRMTLLVPSDVGIFGLVDSGRVFNKGETSDTWHTGVGGGVWVAVLKPENTVSVAVAKSEGSTRFYFRAGFGF